MRVLVIAEDECLRVTCAEVLARWGFEPSCAPTLAARDAADTDAILLWDGQGDQAVRAPSLVGVAAVVVCTWSRRRAWPGANEVVSLPFEPERVTAALRHAVTGRGVVAAVG
jgi:hypothetical protein